MQLVSHSVKPPIVFPFLQVAQHDQLTRVQDPGDAEQTSYTYLGIVLCQLETHDLEV